MTYSFKNLLARVVHEPPKYLASQGDRIIVHVETIERNRHIHIICTRDRLVPALVSQHLRLKDNNTVRVFSSSVVFGSSTLSQTSLLLPSSSTESATRQPLLQLNRYNEGYVLFTKRGTKHGEPDLINPHSRATLMAVRMLSPVHITQRIPAVFSSEMTGVVVGFSLFSKMIKPRKTRSDSACSRVIFWILTQLSFL